ncbi:hypothetical protein D4764_01G0007470 [Takifugu flavidus]|uniref:Ig-like domain-containing protein n=1 Tax=Takifugu flavidus TaxID=433684 RepID=A0A5C6PM87_9TELE|nr:hypothetical protein D4764_01G0007470 [Takifugu flavidus]
MHSDFVSLRNSMFHLNQAALLFILQLFMWKVFAGVIPPEQRNLTVVRGETVTLNCNVEAGEMPLWLRRKQRPADYWINLRGDHRTTDENNQLAREQEEESLRGEAQFNLRSIGLQNRTAV